MTDVTDLPTIILVHGAWVDGSSWANVIVALGDRGYKVIAAPLPLASLGNDIASLQAVIDRTQGSVVLVGHAYSGAVISGIQDERVSALVYIAGLAPAQSETVADVFYRNEPHPLAPKLALDSHGLIWLPDEAFASAFAQNATPEDQALSSATQRPISPACITVPVGRPLWKDIPSWYLLAEQDRMIIEPTQRYMAERMRARVVALPVDHAPSVTAPDAVVALILEALAEVHR